MVLKTQTVKDAHSDDVLLRSCRWKPVDLPATLGVYAATPSLLQTVGITDLAAKDPSGARGLLRYAAAARLESAIADVVITSAGSGSTSLGSGQTYAYAKSGPAVDSSGRKAWVSLARTPGLVAVAVADRRIGVDVETVQTPDQAGQLLSVLHQSDRQSLDHFSGRRRCVEITAAWTRKEATMKAGGVGLGVEDPAGEQTGTITEPQAPLGWRSLSVMASPPCRQAGDVVALGTHIIAVTWRSFDGQAPRHQSYVSVASSNV